MSFFLNSLYAILIILCFIYIIILYEYSNIEWAIIHEDETKYPFVSIIVPTLNEEKNIASCLESLANLDYPDYEIIVVDGGSKDKTVEIAKNYTNKVIVDDYVPPNWIGKSYGCYLGAKKAVGDLLLFTDADTYHSPSSLKVFVSQLLGTDSALLSFLPFQKSLRWYENLIGFYFFLAFLGGGPLEAINNPYDQSSFLAIGQYLLFTRDGYEKLGGHEAVHDIIVEDLAFAKLCKQKHVKLYYMGSQNLVTCRMYPDGFKSFFYGFHKSIWSGINTFPLWRVAFIVLWLIYTFVAPFTLISAILIDPTPVSVIANLLAYIACGWMYWKYWHDKGETKWYYYVLFPLSMAVNVAIIILSILNGVLGRKFTWRARTYDFVPLPAVKEDENEEQ